MMRLDKYLSNHGGLSRTEARIAIRSSIVTINGEIIKSASQKVSPDDAIFVLNKEITLTTDTYLAFHKPEGVICSNEDEEHETVIDLLADYDNLDLKIAGRLDKDTTGLVLLSTDGKWVHRVTSPNYKSSKKYLIHTADAIDPALVDLFKNGIMLKDSPKLTHPATLTILSEKSATLELTEGRYHQVKRMFGASGNKVLELHRSHVGGIDLSGIEKGKCRQLTETEVSLFDNKNAG